jgi:hypothetical protein
VTSPACRRLPRAELPCSSHGTPPAGTPSTPHTKPLGRGLSRLRSIPRSRLCGLAPKRGAVWAARGRSVLSSSLAPGGSLLAVSDSLGRISLVDLVDLLVVRMFKGHCRPPARPRTALCAASPRLSEQRLRPIHRFAPRTGRLDERLDCTVLDSAVRYRVPKLAGGLGDSVVRTLRWSKALGLARNSQVPRGADAFHRARRAAAAGGLRAAPRAARVLEGNAPLDTNPT